MSELFPGYAIEKLPEDGTDQPQFAYKVTGPRGKNWKLMRNKINRHMLFPIPEKFLSGPLKIRGYSWFSDRDGTLKACS